jgi:hypothetical protein
LAFEDDECRGLTLRLNPEVEEQIVKDKGEKSDGGAEYVLIRLHDK